MSRITVVLLMVLCACLIFAISVNASGIWVDDFLVTNNGTIVFSDNYDDGDISDWSSQNDAFVADYPFYSKGKSIHMDCHGRGCSVLFHRFDMGSPGITEVSAQVYLPSPAAQYEWHTNTQTFTNLVLYSGNTTANIYAGIWLKPGEEGYRVDLNWNSSTSKGTGRTELTSIVVKPNKWYLLALRLDADQKKAFAFLDGSQMLSIDYDTQDFQTIKSASMWGWLGDRGNYEATSAK